MPVDKTVSKSCFILNAFFIIHFATHTLFVIKIKTQFFNISNGICVHMASMLTQRQKYQNVYVRVDHQTINSFLISDSPNEDAETGPRSSSEYKPEYSLALRSRCDKNAFTRLYFSLSEFLLYNNSLIDFLFEIVPTELKYKNVALECS